MNAICDGFDGRLPDATEYQALCSIVVDHPLASKIRTMRDPFSDGYKAAVLELYGLLSGKKDGLSYSAEHDERSASDGVVPERIWTDIIPWSFRDARLVSEFLFSWGQILRLLGVGAGDSVLEYGPGSGQILVLLARLGILSFGVDIDVASVAAIRSQAKAMDLRIEVEHGLFGSGFEGRRFNAVLFFEAFHHSIEFLELLRRLQDRVAAGGRIVLCGEPVVETERPEIPFAWGPRLDGLSVYSTRRWGWMELGFTRKLIEAAARETGWAASFHRFDACSRANAFVLERHQGQPADSVASGTTHDDLRAVAEVQKATSDVGELERLLRAMETSNSWKVTAPFRAVKRGVRRLWGPEG